MTILQLYQHGKQSLGVGAVDEFGLQALLMAYEGFTTPSEVLLHLDQTAKNEAMFYQGVERLKQGEPVAYIVGFTTFYGLTLSVSPAVLIPRPETEELVAIILKKFPHHPNFHVVDIGTGSGAIALALKYHRPFWELSATDIDPQALKIAQANSEALALPIHWHLGDGLSQFKPHQRIDLVVSNPPYIDDVNKMDSFVKAYEPMRALYAAPATLYYEQYMKQAKQWLKPHGQFAFEIDPSLVGAITAIAQRIFPLANTEVIQDINRKNRLMLIYT